MGIVRRGLSGALRIQDDLSPDDESPSDEASRQTTKGTSWRPVELFQPELPPTLAPTSYATLPSPATLRRKPIGTITQYNPGIFKDSQGGYFTGTSMDDAQYRGDDPSVFKLGGQSTPTAAVGNPTEAAPSRPTEPTPAVAASQSVDRPRTLIPPRIPTSLMPPTEPDASAQLTPATAAPSRPKEPTPIAAQAATPTTQQGSSQALGDLSPIVRRGLVPGASSGPRVRLFGKAGGLLGGGLGVPGLGASGEQDDISALIKKIWRRRRAPRQSDF